MKNHQLEIGDNVVVTDMNGNTHNLFVLYIPPGEGKVWKFTDMPLVNPPYAVYFFQNFSHIRLVAKAK